MKCVELQKVQNYIEYTGSDGSENIGGNFDMNILSDKHIYYWLFGTMVGI